MAKPLSLSSTRKRCTISMVHLVSLRSNNQAPLFNATAPARCMMAVGVGWIFLTWQRPTETENTVSYGQYSPESPFFHPRSNKSTTRRVLPLPRRDRPRTFVEVDAIVAGCRALLQSGHV